MVRRRQRAAWSRLIRASAASGLAAFGLACGQGSPAQAPAAALLAVGDTGARPDREDDTRRLLGVGRAMAQEDARSPVDALLLLGDNFYDAGLEPDALVERVRHNVVAPFCHFVRLDAPRSPELADVCPARSGRRIPLLALLGNHDRLAPDSLRLQRDAVPQLVSNWRAQREIAERIELPGGLSLVLLDSERVAAGADAGPLVDALAAARGPWIVVAAHRPILELRRRSDEQGVRERRYAGRVRAALAKSPVRVHVFLSGHEHNLQALRGAAPGPALHAIAGSASNVRRIRVPHQDRLLGLEAPGFARIDRIGEGASARLLVTLRRLPPGPLEALAPGSRVVARFEIDRDGGLSGR